jgi:metal-responsive CopG/Arc/MetJ family transcriptional regulator
MWYNKFTTSYTINERMKDMPTKKPIISIVLDEETLEKVEDFQYNNRIPSRSKALNEIIKMGIEQLKKQQEGE